MAPATGTIPVQLPVACLKCAQPPRRGRPALTTQPGEGTAGAPRTPIRWIPGGPARVVHTPGRCQQQNQPAYQASHRQQAIRTRHRTRPQPDNQAHAKRGEPRCTHPTSPQLNPTATGQRAPGTSIPRGTSHPAGQHRRPARPSRGCAAVHGACQRRAGCAVSASPRCWPPRCSRQPRAR